MPLAIVRFLRYITSRRGKVLILKNGDMVIRKDREPENNGSLGAEFKLLPLLLFCIAFFALLSLISYSPEDVNSIYGGSYAVPGNWIGPFGAHFSWYMLLNFGLVA